MERLWGSARWKSRIRSKSFLMCCRLETVFDALEVTLALENVDGALQVAAGNVLPELQAALPHQPLELLVVDVVHGDVFEPDGVVGDILCLGCLKDLGGGFDAVDIPLDGQQLIVKLGGELVAALDDGVDGLGGEAEHAVIVDVGVDVQVAKLAVFLVVAHGYDVHQLGCQLGQRLEVVDIAFEHGRHLDADDDVGADVATDVGGEVVYQTAVHKHLAIEGHRREDAWDGHAGADGFRELAATQHDGITRDDVGGDTGKGDGQLVEVDGILVADAKAVEKVEQVGASDEGVGERGDEG